MYNVENEPSGSFDYYATVEGVYSFCYSNRNGPHKTVIAKIAIGEPPDLIQVRLAATRGFVIRAAARRAACWVGPSRSDARARCTLSPTCTLVTARPQLAKTEHLTPIEERIKSLHESMNAVRDLQDQLRDQVRVRRVADGAVSFAPRLDGNLPGVSSSCVVCAQDETHDKMSRSTKSWLLYFTLLEAVVLVAVSLWQILYLRSFFEVKRVV